MNSLTDLISFVGLVLTIIGIVLTYIYRLKIYELAVEVIELFDLKHKSKVIVNIARKYYEKGNYKKAITLLVRSLKLNKDIEAYKLLSKCFYSLEMYADAIKSIDIALEYIQKQSQSLDSKVIGSFYARKSDNLYFLKKYPESLIYINKAIKLEKDYTYLMFKGQVLYALGKYNKSIIWYEKSLEFHKEKAFIYILMAQSRREQYLYKEAIDLLNMALTYNSPDDVKYQEINNKCENLKQICAEKLIQFPDGNYPLEKEKGRLKSYSIEDEFVK